MRMFLLVGFSVGVFGTNLPECTVEDNIPTGTCCTGTIVIENGATSRIIVRGGCIDAYCDEGNIKTSMTCKCSQTVCGCFVQGKFYRRGQVLKILKNNGECTQIFCNSDGETGSRGISCDKKKRKFGMCFHNKTWYGIGDHVYTDRVSDLCADAYCAPYNRLYYTSYFTCDSAVLSCRVDDVDYYSGWIIDQTECYISVCDQNGVFRKLRIPDCILPD